MRLRQLCLLAVLMIGATAHAEETSNTGSSTPLSLSAGSQISELQQTINDSSAELVIIGTPIDLRRFMQIDKPSVRVNYELEEINPQLGVWLSKILQSGKGEGAGDGA